MCLINELTGRMMISKGKLITFDGRKKVEISFPELFPRVQAAAAWLRGKGFDSDTVLCIIGKNDLEWIIADLACIYCGIKLLPLEPGAVLAQYQSDRLRIAAVLVSAEFKEEAAALGQQGYTCIGLQELNTGTAEQAGTPHTYAPMEVISYKSTSGSTGLPKVIGHAAAGLSNSLEGTQEIFQHSPRERILVFLPLNILQQRYWLYSAILYDLTVIIIPRSYVFAAVKQDKPTVIMGVPYIYEVFYDEFSTLLRKDDSLREAYNAFLASGSRAARFGPFHEFLGGHINYLWTGSAPVSKEILSFYFNMGIPLYQGYGMNETCIISKNYTAHNKTGSVGKLFKGITLRFDDNGQILVKSDFPVCHNYTIAGEQERAQTFRPDGYVATGDCGYMDEEGYLFVTGRIKDIIILSNSKKVFPRSIEEKIETNTGIAHCVVYGDNKPYLVAMIVPAADGLTEGEVKSLLKTFNDQAREEEKIFRYCIQTEQFSMQNDLLSNQHKIKRQKIYQQFLNSFEELYK